MTENRLVFVCEHSPGFACIAAALATARSTDETTAVGGPIKAAGFVHKRVTDAGRQVDCDVQTGRVEPVDIGTLRDADHVVAIGQTPDWVMDLPNTEHWEGTYPTVADPNTTRDAIERIKRRVNSLLVTTSDVDATTSNAGKNVGD